MKTLLTPRGYLSHTQIQMWLTDPEKYVRKYMLGESGEFTNSGMVYGKKTSLALENGDAEGDELLNAVISLLPRYDVPEHEIRAFLETPKGKVELLGKLDTFSTKTKAYREYKTGRHKWTYGKAASSPQMRQYHTLIYLKHGILPPQAHLDWVETEEVDGDVRFTGKIESFAVELTMKDVLEYMAMVSKVAVEIDKRYREELKKLT